MTRSNKLDECFDIIEDFFDKSTFKSFNENKFREIFRQNRYNWDVPKNKISKQVLRYLINKKVISNNVFSGTSNSSKIVYSWKTQDEFTIISGIKNNSYFAFYTALFLHQLSYQIPKTFYLNFEHSSTINQNAEENLLTQEEIDEAFRGGQRKSSLSYSYMDKKIILTNGKYTNKLGVIKRVSESECYYYTDVERTLIDISVRPVYAGGVFEVLNAYRNAKGRLDVAKMADYLSLMNFKYPYHQVIGFYLEKAEYRENEIEYFMKKMEFNFYLTYDIRNKDFSEKWKLYYPKGL
jgi:hypothetical protein